MNQLLIFGRGYSGTAIADAAQAAGFAVTATTRAGETGTIRFDAADAAIRSATHLLTTAGPDGDQDPVLARYGAAIAAAPDLRWIGYLSTTGVYGDRGGGWVDEDTPAAPSQARGQRRLEVENAWSAFADRRTVDIFRLAGIYGPGRSALDDVRAGRARRLIAFGHKFGRIHRNDIARAVVAAMRQDRTIDLPLGRRVLNLNDDEPSESALVVAEAAALLGAPPPPAIGLADALPGMSPMARGFWAESRQVASAKTKAALGISWLYPTYREGLRGILAEELGQRSP
ncbi:SDR family NAD(P)-dependent oxidoreductase [Rhodopila sp.]|uniref:SDR family NAD(P)-dependent oxidoreductase n=1 Tax=Rhodopila sp. TaxID=2480087 RepID=UPI003D0BDB34